MSYSRDESTGQFTPSTEGLYGREHELAEAGYKPMPDPAKHEEFASARDAVEAMGVPPEQPADEIAYYDTATGDQTDPKETITVEQAARDLTNWHDQKAAFDAKSISEDFAAEVDKMRANALQQNPKAAEHYGIETPNAVKTAADALNENKGDAATDTTTGLDPALEKALKHPQVRQAIEEQLGEANKSREAYSTGLSNAHAFAQAAFFEAVPELRGLAPEQLEQGLALLAQVDPPKFNTAMNVLNRVHAIQTAQQHNQQQQAHVARQNFDTYAKEQDANFRSMVDFAPAKMQEVGDEMVAYASELGIERDQLVHLLQNEPIIRHAAFQKMIYDAVQGRLSQKRSSTATKAIPRDIPAVQRPGTSQPRGSQRSEKMSSLEAKFNRTGDLRDAQELYSLMLSRG